MRVAPTAIPLILISADPIINISNEPYVKLVLSIPPQHAVVRCNSHVGKDCHWKPFFWIERDVSDCQENGIEDHSSACVDLYTWVTMSVSTYDQFRLTLLLVERWIRFICRQRASMCFDSISEAAIRASSAASLIRNSFRSIPMSERWDSCIEENEIFCESLGRRHEGLLIFNPQASFYCQ